MAPFRQGTGDLLASSRGTATEGRVLVVDEKIVRQGLLRRHDK
jgi:hypothetical protein